MIMDEKIIRFRQLSVPIKVAVVGAYCFIILYGTVFVLSIISGIFLGL